MPFGTVPIFPVSPTHEGNRIEYRHPGITEWYVNGEQGLEHGFTIAERPAGDGELVIEGRWAGLRPRNGQDGILLKDDTGGEVLQCAKLEVRDATGALVPARMLLQGDSPRIVISEGEASCLLPVAAKWIQWILPDVIRTLELTGHS